MITRSLIVLLLIIGIVVRAVAMVLVVSVLAVWGMNRASRRFVGTFNPRF